MVSDDKSFVLLTLMRLSVTNSVAGTKLLIDSSTILHDFLSMKYSQGTGDREGDLLGRRIGRQHRGSSGLLAVPASWTPKVIIRGVLYKFVNLHI